MGMNDVKREFAAASKCFNILEKFAKPQQERILAILRDNLTEQASQDTPIGLVPVDTRQVDIFAAQAE